MIINEKGRDRERGGEEERERDRTGDIDASAIGDGSENKTDVPARRGSAEGRRGLLSIRGTRRIKKASYDTTS